MSLLTNFQSVQNKIDDAKKWSDFILQHSSAITQLQYISSSGTQYINTGITFTNNTIRLECKAKGLNSPGTNKLIYGANASSNTFTGWYGGTANWRYANYAVSVPGMTNVDMQISHSKTSVIVNNTTYSYGGTGSTYGGNICLFGDVTRTADNGTVAIYYFKIWKDGSLVRDFIPVRNELTGVISMYDKVSNTYFTNAGTGEFIAGPEI